MPRPQLVAAEEDERFAVPSVGATVGIDLYDLITRTRVDDSDRARPIGALEREQAGGRPAGPTAGTDVVCRPILAVEESDSLQRLALRNARGRENARVRGPREIYKASRDCRGRVALDRKRERSGRSGGGRRREGLERGLGCLSNGVKGTPRGEPDHDDQGADDHERGEARDQVHSYL